MGSETEQVLRDRAERPMTIPGLAMGWQKYDVVTQGQKPNELVVVVARSKTGKSAFLLNHAKKFSVNDHLPGLYIDTEMTSREQEDRLLSCVSGVPYEEIVNGMFARDTIYGLASDKQAKLFSALEIIRSSPLYHIYMPSFTIEKVTALVRKYYLQHNLAYVIFDYIKLPNSEVNDLANAQEYQRLGFITTCLKDLAGICNIPVITAAQANRSGEMHGDEQDIGGSYRIIQMATRIIFLRKKTDQELATDGWQRGNMKLKIGFQRNGASSADDIDFLFDGPTLRFTEIQ
jgi:replicative DNA helicase